MTVERFQELEQTTTFVEEALVAGNRGPCGGVYMAFEAADQVLAIRDIFAGYRVEATDISQIDPKLRVYSLWDIVHNKPIMKDLAKRGLVSVNLNLDLIPDAAAVIKPAHGGPPWLDDYATEHNWQMIDVTCQLVTRVQNLAKRAEREGKHVVYIGVNKHPETVGVMGQIDQQNVTLVEKPDDVLGLNLPSEKPKIVFSQTTLSPREVLKVEEVLLSKYPQVEIPNRLDICYATFNRQEAVQRLIDDKGIQMLVVVGSGHSHNSKELRDLGLFSGMPSYLVDYPQDLRIGWFTPWIKKVGLTSGASVLDRFLEPVLLWMMQNSPKLEEVIYENQVVKEEDMIFKLPERDIEALRARWAA